MARYTVYHRRRDAGLCPKCGRPYHGIWIHCDACRPVLAAAAVAARRAAPLPKGLRHEGTGYVQWEGRTK